MSAACNGRIYEAVKETGRNFKVVWPQRVNAVDRWGIQANSPHEEAGLDFIVFPSQPGNSQSTARDRVWGDSQRRIGELRPEVLIDLPNAPENMKNAIVLDAEFWVESLQPLDEQFEQLAAQ